MKKFVITFYIFFAVAVSQAAIDSSAVAIKNDVTKHNKKSKTDSTQIKLSEVKKDSNQATVKTDSVHFSADSLQKFVDKNGDGFNDNAPDDDGDGIPNALDKDYWADRDIWSKNRGPSILGNKRSSGVSGFNGPPRMGTKRSGKPTRKILMPKIELGKTATNKKKRSK